MWAISLNVSTQGSASRKPGTAMGWMTAGTEVTKTAAAITVPNTSSSVRTVVTAFLTRGVAITPGTAATQATKEIAFLFPVMRMSSSVSQPAGASLPRGTAMVISTVWTIRTKPTAPQDVT